MHWILFIGKMFNCMGNSDNIKLSMFINMCKKKKEKKVHDFMKKSKMSL